MLEKAPKEILSKLWVASDHAGFDLKSILLEKRSDLPWEDLGTFSEDRVDYPDFAKKLSDHIQNPQDFGILVCGSGQGMAMKANRTPRVRAALCWAENIAELARSHNNANVLCLGSRTMNHNLCLKILDVFLQTPFEGGRHKGRVEKLFDS